MVFSRNLHLLPAPWILLVANLLCAPCPAEIPPEQAYDLYLHTDPGQLDRSPFWGMVALKTGVLPTIRFFGAYTGHPHPHIPPHGSLRPEDSNCPQDAISGVIEYLFPSPDGVNFVHNDRDNDPIGRIDLEQETLKHMQPAPGGLRKIAALLRAVAQYRTVLGSTAPHAPGSVDPGAGAFREEVQGILTIHRLPGEKSEKGRRIRSYNLVRDQFAGLLQQAVQEEVQDANRHYPPGIVEIALLAYAWKDADDASDLYQAFGAEGLLREPAPGTPRVVFDSAYYAAHLQEFLGRTRAADPAAAPSPGETVAFVLADKSFSLEGDRLALPAMLDYSSASYVTVLPPPALPVTQTYPDCGETSLRNFFNIVLMRQGVFDSGLLNNILGHLAEPVEAGGYRPDGRPFAALGAFYEAHPNLTGHYSRPTRDAWSQLVSNLNREADPIPIIYGAGTHNLKGTGVRNMLNLIGHLIPDPQLNQPWPEGEDPEAIVKRQDAIASRLTRLCTLVSTDQFRLDWAVDGRKQIKDEIVNIRFFINEVPAFQWDFMNRHFSIRTLFMAKEAWPTELQYGSGNYWVDAALLPYNLKPNNTPEYRPVGFNRVFTYNLRTPDLAHYTANAILTGLEPQKLPTLSLLFQRSIPIDQHVLLDLSSRIYKSKEFLQNHHFYPIPGLRNQPDAPKTALLIECVKSRNGSEYIAQLMIDHGANVNGKDASGDPLLSLSANIPKFRDLLLRCGANLEEKNARGRSPLSLAIGKGNYYEAMILLEKGADPLSKDIEGRTPWDYAHGLAVPAPRTASYENWAVMMKAFEGWKAAHPSRFPGE